MTMRGLRSDTRGQALLEFALILPILLLLVLGIVEFGRIWNINQMVSDTTREGARRAVVFDQPPATEQAVHDFMMQRLWDAHVDTTVVTIAFSQNTASGHWKVSGWDQTVTVQFPYSFMFFTRAFGTVLITSSFTMRNE
jgi:Flp pilus assembly protein TadG